MRPKLTRLLAFALFASSSSSALAQALEWRVSETSGPVSLVNGDQKRAVTRGMKLQPGDAVHAGPGGRAVLVQGRDFVTVSANSRVTVPTADKATGFVKLLQDWGQALFKIEKKGTPHFGVNTPSLAAVVKGTTFSITVDRSGSSLQVTEGAVEVATLDGGARDLLRPGGLASIAAADPYRLNVRGDEVRVLDSPARATAEPSAAAPEPAAEAVAPPVEVPVETPVETAVTIDMGVSSAPADLSQVTGGLIAGTAAPVQLAAITATVRAAAAEAPAPVETPTPAPAPPSDSGSQTPPAPENQPPTPAPVQPAAPSDSGNGNGQGNGSGQGNGNAGGSGQGGGNAPVDPGPGNANGGGQGNGNAGGNGQAGGGAPADPGPGNGNGGNGQGGGSGPANPGAGNGNAGPGSEAGNGGNGEEIPGPGKGRPGKGDDDDRDDDDDDDDDGKRRPGKDDDDDDDDDDGKRGDSVRMSSVADGGDASAARGGGAVQDSIALSDDADRGVRTARGLRDAPGVERPR